MNKIKKVPLMFLDGVIWLMNYLKGYISKENISNIEAEVVTEDMQFDLVPSYLKPENENYQCVIDIANKLNDKKIKNIALTGSYGSGKSSVLETLQEDYKQFHYLKISLATFKTNDENSNIENAKSVNIIDNDSSLHGIPSIPGTQNNTIDSEERINRLLEYSILQQIIYHEKISTIPESRFKRIKHIPNNLSVLISIGIISFLLCLDILFEPAFLIIPSLQNLLSFDQTVKIFIDIICLVVIIIQLVIAVYFFIRTSQNSKLNKINLKDGVIEIDKENNNSILNKHLDEIIYFFEVTEYNVVIIEDLDRFDTAKIFSKLRELNRLINNSKCIDRHVPFIYAVRDNIFKDTLRTKFFDYIVAVIPIMNPSNSGDLLIQYLKVRMVTDITDRQCKDLGIFIDDMRMLKNIVNEFLQYKKKLNPKLAMYKLLAMIIYKNYYPQDFVDLQNMNGLVYSAFQNKKKYSQKSSDNIDSKIQFLELDILNIEHQKFVSLKELRSVYILKYINNKPNIICFSIDKLDCTFEQVQNEDDFNKLINGEINNFKYLSGNTYQYTPLGVKFEEIEKQVDPNKTYSERVELWNKRENNEINLIKRNIQDLNNKKIEIVSQSLNIILSSDKDLRSSFFDDMSEQKLIVFLLQNGYIDNNYNDYISFFHPGSITTIDNDFLINLKIGKASEFSYSLNKIEALLTLIPLNLFKKPIILNISLIDFIIENETSYKQHVSYFIQSLKKNEKKAFEFLHEYIYGGKNTQKLIKILANQWEELWCTICESEFPTPDDKEYYLYCILEGADIEDFHRQNFNDRLSSHLNKNFSLLATWQEKIGLERLTDIIEKLNLRFEKLSMASKPDGLLKHTVSKNRYELCIDNIKIILLHDSLSSMLINTFDSAIYTAILESGNESLIENVKNNLKFCIEKIFNASGKSIYEQEPALIKIVSDWRIYNDIRNGYLSKQINKINDINSIDDEFRGTGRLSNWDLGLQSNIIKATWNNIISYNKIHGYTSILINFLSKECNFSELGKNMFEESQEADDESVPQLIESILTTDKFSLECFKNLRKGFDINFIGVDFSILSKNKVQVLIETEVIVLNEYNLNILRKTYPGLSFELIIKHKSKYLKQVLDFKILENEPLDLLKSSSFRTTEKFKIIQTFTIDILNNNAELSTLICQILNNHLTNCEVLFEFFKNIIYDCSEYDLKIALVTQYLRNNLYNEENTTSLLLSLPFDYWALAIKKKRPTYENNEINRNLFEYLDENKFIHSFAIKGKRIKVLAKTK